MTVLSDALFAAQFLDKGGAVFNVKHPDFDAAGDGVADDGPAWNLARTAVPANGGVVLVPPGSYLLTTAFTFDAQSNVLLCIMSGVVLTGSALPTPTGTNAIVDWRSGVIDYSGTIKADDIEVGGDLDLAGDIELSERTPAEITGNVNDYNTGATTVQRLSSDASRNITGFAGGRAGRLILVANVGFQNIVLLHSSASSIAANRILLPNGASLTIGSDEGVSLYYDSTSSKWRVMSAAT